MDNEMLVKSIRELCQTKGIAISQLETDLGFGAGLISRWTKSSPSIDKIIDIANYFKVSLDEIVGYNQITSDEFINILLKQTQNAKIQWHSYEKNKNDDISTLNFVGFNTNQYDPAQYNDSTYYTQYKEGYIQVYSVYENDNIINPEELYLLIQPDKKAKLITQHCQKDEIKLLYLKILKSLNDEAPDEIKAEELKNAFINDFKNPKPQKSVSLSQARHTLI